jgi:hypothetical protein
MATQFSRVPSFGGLDCVAFTCVFGYTDPLHDPLVSYKPERTAKDYTGNDVYHPRSGDPLICFTDQPIKSNRWEIVTIPPQIAPKRFSRYIKALAHRWFPNAVTVYLDANMTLLKHPSQIARQYQGDFVNFRHQWRNRISEEAEAIIRWKKAKPDAIWHQLATYQADGFDTDKNPQIQLSCNGVILRRPESETLCEMWWDEINRHTLRDQMSIDYCAWKLGKTLGKFKGDLRTTDLVTVSNYSRPVNDY